MKVAFIYYKFYDFDHGEIFVGGAEHYIYRLSKVCADNGLEPLVFQISSEPFEIAYHHVKIVGVKPLIKKSSFYNQTLYKAALERIDVSTDLLIFAADLCSVKTDSPRCISINHGLFWDYPTSMGGPYPYRLKGILGSLYKEYKKFCMRRLFDNCMNRVCVDYNFLNWYRTAINEINIKRITVVPNFAQIAERKQLVANTSAGNIKILFARRFSEYRGTRIMAEAAKNVLARYDNVDFTFAGDGPDEGYLKAVLADDPHVTFTRFSMDESLSVNLKHDICVIPSLAAEGTSLSVAEAMGAGKAVVASNVGGITNMIIDGYNGLLINPDADSLTEALIRLIDDKSLRHTLGTAAYETASRAFSYERWEASWIKILREVSGHKINTVPDAG